MKKKMKNFSSTTSPDMVPPCVETARWRCSSVQFAFIISLKYDKYYAKKVKRAY